VARVALKLQAAVGHSRAFLPCGPVADGALALAGGSALSLLSSPDCRHARLFDLANSNPGFAKLQMQMRRGSGDAFGVDKPGTSTAEGPISLLLVAPWSISASECRLVYRTGLSSLLGEENLGIWRARCL
jgi:hypothetical protein